MIFYWGGRNWEQANFYRENNSSVAILVCGGPSMNRIDLSKLKGPGKVVVGMNNTYPKVLPDMWIGMDHPHCYSSSLTFESFPKFFRGGFHRHKYVTENTEVDVWAQNSVFYVNVAQGYYVDMKRRAENRKSENLVWTGNSFTFAFSLLYYMGFRKVYLVGCDLDNSTSDYHNDIELTEKQKDWNAHLYKHLYGFLTWMKNINFDEGFLEVVSMSPMSRINDLFPYKSIEELNAEINNNIPKQLNYVHSSDIDKIGKE